MPQTPTVPRHASALQRSWVVQHLAAAAPSLGVTQCVLRSQRVSAADRWRRRLNEAWQRCPVLRLAFELADPLNPKPILLAAASAPSWEESQLAEADLLKEDRLRGFDLTEGPLFRMTVVHPGQGGEWLLLTAHSALLDAASIRSLAEWLTTDESSPTDGLDSFPPLAPSPEMIAKFWKPRLEGWVPTLALHEQVGFARGIDEPLATARAPMSAELIRGIASLADRLDVPREVIVEVAWGIALGALARTERPCLGRWMSSRQASSHRSWGVGGNIIPFRLELPPQTPADLVLSEVGRDYEAFREHAEASIHELAAWAGRRRGELLFDSAIRCDWSPKPDPSVEMRLIEQPGIPLIGTAYFNGGELELGYSPSAIPVEFAQSWLAMWKCALEGLIRHPERPLGELPLIAADASAEAWQSWNASERDYPRGEIVPDLVEPVLKTAAPQLAVISSDGTLTFSELDQWSGALAAELQRAGVGPDDRVAICLERGKLLPAAVLGILRSGAAYAPIDPNYPVERIQWMLQAAEPKAIVTHSRLRDRIGSWEGRIHCVDEGVGARGDAGALIGARPTPDSLAYVIFTSGSTGTPKGVAMVHRALTNLIRWQLDESRALPEASRTLQFASLSFDVSFQEIFATWAAGGALVMIGEEERRDPTLLWDTIERQQIARLFLPFVALQQLAEEAERRASLPAGLREIITAGEQLQSSPQLRGLLRRLPGCRLVNQYGPSETHVASAFALPRDPDAWPLLPPIGRPIANAKMCVLDAQRRLLPAGAPGEIFLGGACLARGYLNRPELTNERFESIAWEGIAPQRVYRTGDLGRWNAAGQMEFLGRCDDQVKIRGHRVELAEVEAALLKHPAVRAAVAAANGAGADRQLAAYLISADRQLSPAALRDHLKLSLPDYMIPGSYTFLDQFPLTPSGKVDRRALLAYAPSAAPSAPAPLTPPADPLEADLRQMWESLLPGARVGVTDNFFDLGGTSLLAVRLQHQLEAKLKRRVPIVTLFQNPTIRGLARVLPAEGERALPIPAEIAQRAAKQRQTLARRRPVTSLRS